MDFNRSIVTSYCKRREFRMVRKYWQLLVICVVFLMGCASPANKKPTPLPEKSHLSSVPDHLPESCALKGLTMPKVLEEHPVEFPPDVKSKGIQGKVILRLTITKKGTVSSARIVNGLHPTLNLSALKAARKMKFTPAMQDCKPIRIEIPYQFVFSLDS